MRSVELLRAPDEKTLPEWMVESRSTPPLDISHLPHADSTGLSSGSSNRGAGRAGRVGFRPGPTYQPRMPEPREAAAPSSQSGPGAALRLG